MHCKHKNKGGLLGKKEQWNELFKPNFRTVKVEGMRKETKPVIQMAKAAIQVSFHPVHTAKKKTTTKQMLVETRRCYLKYYLTVCSFLPCMFRYYLENNSRFFRFLLGVSESREQLDSGGREERERERNFTLNLRVFP